MANEVTIVVKVNTATKHISVAPGSGLDAFGVALVLTQAAAQYIAEGMKQNNSGLVLPMTGLKLS